MDKEMFDTLLKAIVDMKDSMNKHFEVINKGFDTIKEKIDIIEEDIADIKSYIMRINAE